MVANPSQPASDECGCGCGQKTPIATTTRRGNVAGQPTRYLRGHGRWAYRPREELTPASGQCLCGCGQQTSIATRTRNGNVAGEPSRYVSGHSGRWGSRREPRWEDRGYETPCLIWQMGLTKGGYGQYARGLTAHRVAYERAKGPIPTGCHLHHLCQQRDCVNPDHLQPLQPREHVRVDSRVRLTAELVREIKRQAAAMEGSPFRKGRELAPRFGVPAGCIRDMLRGKSWADVVG